MDLGLTGRRALVTAASSGLGLGCARALVAEGATVVISSRSTARLDAASRALDGIGSDRGGTVAGRIAADVSDAGSLDALCDEAEALLGGIDIIVSNAGGPPAGTFASTDVAAYSDAVALNMIPTISLCKRLIPAMRTRGWGRVVAITSISVREPIGSLILSNTARAGLTGFLKTTATEVAGDGVTVNSLQPGLHATPRLTALHGSLDEMAGTVPTGVLGDPDDFGRVAAFVCSDHARFITGAAIPVDGGSARGLQ